jgi:FtsK/SpoIIIE family
MADYLSVSISVDALEWTEHWLTKQQRCDVLSISIACNERVNPKIKLLAIESKARSEVEPFPLTVEAEPFKKGIPQVISTLEALQEILCEGEGTDVLSDLKQGAFVEHLLSEVLSRIYPVPPEQAAAFTYVIKQLTLLSRRELSCESDLEMRGMVVATQRRSTAPTVRELKTIRGDSRDWKIELIRCGVPHLRAIFEEMGLAFIAQATVGTAAPPSDSAQPLRDCISTQLLSDRLAAEDQIPYENKNETEPAPVKVLVPREPLTADVEDTVSQLETALVLRQFPTEPVDRTLTVVGPTLISVPVVLKAGHSSKQIEQATKDIARELGVRSITVENDTRAYHIRFLIPRKDRIFPELPENSAIASDSDRNHYLGLLLGVGVDGQPFRSFISEWPHLLVAGTTGSGKTTFLKSILLQLATLPSGKFETVIVDGKAEYDYVGLIPKEAFASQFPDVLLGHEHATTVLEWLVEAEIPRRRTVLRDYFSKNAKAPRQPREALVSAWTAEKSFPIKPIILFIDEFAEIMQAAGPAARDFEALVQRAVQTGRSALVHLMLATQRPDASVIAGAIKANLPSRVALALPSHHDSMTIINTPGAEDLVGSGDMLFLASSGGIYRLQAFKA